MKTITTGFVAAMLLGLAVASSVSTPALALSADLAIKCRQMAIERYPPTRPGVKRGTAEEERNFYRDCVANKGSMPDGNPSKPNAAPPK